MKWENEVESIVELVETAEQDVMSQLATLGCIDRCGYEDLAYTGEDARILWAATEDMDADGLTLDEELLWESL